MSGEGGDEDERDEDRAKDVRRHTDGKRQNKKKVWERQVGAADAKGNGKKLSGTQQRRMEDVA